MPLVLPFLVLLALAPAEERFEAPIAALAFAPLPGFESVTTRPPAVYEAVLRAKTQERARLVLFVAPAPAEADPSEALSAALQVAAAYTACLASYSGPAPAAEETVILRGEDGRDAALLAFVPEPDRFLGLLLFGRAAEVDGLAEDLLDSVRSLSEPAGGHPFEPPLHVAVPEHGCALRLPAGFEPQEDVLAPCLVEAHLPFHLGLPAVISLSLEKKNLELPLEEAARELRDRLAAEEGTTLIEFAEEQLGSLPACRIELAHAAPPARSVTHLIDLERHRVRLAMSASEQRFEHFRAAFAATAASACAIERRLKVELQPRFTDSERGFSIRPPRGFERAGGGAALVAFLEATLPPQNGLRIDLLSDIGPPRSLDELKELAIERGGTELEGAPPDLPLSTKLLNGMLAARYATAEGEAAAAPLQVCWLVAAGNAVFDLRFSSRRGEWPLYAELIEASVRSFRAVKRSIAPDLGERVAAAKLRASFRPPRGWRELEQEDARLAFAEESEEALPARVELAADPLPPESRPGGLAEAYRQAVVADLLARGAAEVRVEEARGALDAGAARLRFRIAYNVAGQPLRELREAIQLEDRICYVRAVSGGARFNDLRLLFEACVSSLRAGGE